MIPALDLDKPVRANTKCCVGPGAIALAQVAAPLLGGLFGGGKGGGGASPGIVKQDNYQNVDLNISVGGGANDAFRYQSTAGNFGGFSTVSGFAPSGISANPVSFLMNNLVWIGLGVGGFFLVRYLKR